MPSFFRTNLADTSQPDEKAIDDWTPLAQSATLLNTIQFYEKAIDNCIQSGLKELKKPTISTHNVYTHYKAALRNLDFLKEKLTNLNTSLKIADKLSNKIETLLDEPLNELYAKEKEPLFTVKKG